MLTASILDPSKIFLTRDSGQAKKGPKMLNFLPSFGLAFIALQVSPDCKTNFKSRVARDTRPLAKHTRYLSNRYLVVGTYLRAAIIPERQLFST